MTDAVVIGSGAGGATMADALTAAGWSVVVLEKGRNHLIDPEPPYALRDEFSSDELKMAVRHFLGADPLHEPRSFRRSEGDGERIHVGEVNNLPSTVGGGAIHADAKCPRFREEDFRLHSTLGPVEGAAVEDWPLDYAELEPCYAEAERLIGVAGDAGANPLATKRSGPYPMPPGPPMYGALLSTEAAARLGYHPYPAPTAANSIPYDGRPACNNCGFCGGYPCPIHAKGGAVASLRRALLTGRCRLLAECTATEIVLDRGGRRARAVRYLDAAGAQREISARTVVLAAGAFETPRLLLRCGVGNSSGLVGRFLTYHFQTFAIGIFPQRLHPHRGRAVTHHHDDFVVPSAGARAAAREAGLPYLLGGTVEHGAGTGPIEEALRYPPGPQHPALMRSSPMRERMWVLTMQGEDLPQATNRVDLDPGLRDGHGLPAGRVTYSPHPHEIAASRYYAPLMEEILREAGAERTFASTSPPLDEAAARIMGPAPTSRHVMGTCRMGPDPRTSVVDAFGRFHDVENLVCADASVFVTSAGFNPMLTIVALAVRAAGALTGRHAAAASVGEAP